MKINLKLPAFVLGLMLLLTGTTVKAQDDNVSLQQFYDELSPYGTWIQDPQYGYVWRPDVDQSEFRPYYTNGRWAMTEYGNTWVSNYDWGWAPFHYGRWIYDSYNRWIWIPDTVWGPAWVDWRSGGGYYGWAPMGPVISVNINFGRRYVRPDYCWNFIPQAHIYYDRFPRYRSYNNVRIINRTTIINNTYVYNRRTYYTGPRPEEIRRATNRDVTVYQIARNNRVDAPRIDRNTVNVYSPRPTRDANVQGKPAPRTLGSYNANNNTRDNNNPRVGTRTENNNPGAGRRTESAPGGRTADRTMDRRDEGRTADNGARPGRDADEGRVQQEQQRRQMEQQRQGEQQRQQRDMQVQQDQQRRQADQQQRERMGDQQRQQREMQAQQDQQRRQADQQQRERMADQQRQQREMQVQQDQQRRQADQQQRERQVQQQQQRERQVQQRERQPQVQRQAPPQRTEQSGRGNGGGRSESGGGRPGRGGR